MGFGLVENLRHITVEPLIFMFIWSVPYLDHGNGVLFFNKICIDEHFGNATICDLISHHKANYTEINIKIQSQTSRWIMISKVIMVLPMLYSTTMLGAISDRFHRKLPMIVPAVGVSVGSLWLLVMSLVPSIPLSCILISYFIFGITGYFGTALMATSAYLGALTTPKTRTWRISIFEGALALGGVAGGLTSGSIIDHLGLPYIYGICMVLNLLAVLYTVVHIAELHTIKAERPLWYEICNFAHVKDYVITLYKPRSQNRRFYIHLMFATFMIATCAGQGLGDVMFLYLTKSRGFTNTIYSVFNGAQSVVICFGNVLAMYILKKKMNLTEPVIAIVAAIGSTISFSMIASSDRIVIWTSLIFAVVCGLNGAACRGFLSKLVPEEEQGQVFAFIAMGQCLTTLLAAVTFNNLYPETLRVWDGLCILLAGLLNIIGIFSALIVVLLRKVKGHTDEALDISPEQSTVASSTTDSQVGSDDETTLELTEHKEKPNSAKVEEDKVQLTQAAEIDYGAIRKKIR